MARLIDRIECHSDIWSQLQTQRQSGRLAHALAFVGPSGIGKKKMAWALAQALCCERDPAPCGDCPSCRRIEQSQSESVLLIEPEKNAIRLESAHEVLQFLTLRQLGRARVVVIDDAQLLNPQAANALLKVIEEPPPGSFFILITSEISQLLPTLRSRVQILRFQALPDEVLARFAGDATPAWTVRSARGSSSRLEAFRDSEFQELRERVVEFIVGAVQGQRTEFDSLVQEAKDRESGWHVVHLLQQILRDWSLGDAAEWIHQDLKIKMESLSRIPAERRLQLWRRAFQMENDLHAHVDRVLLFENFYRQASHAMD